ncbi:MAG: hypothetical protein JNM26_12345 [Ideonella sp.]|nr:hypothetical protein [Ideonella sp.]
MPWSSPLSFVLPALLLAGCAAPLAEPAPDPADRWMLTWHRPVSAQPQALADFEAEAGSIAGVPVRRLAAVSDRILVVTLACQGAERCAEARARLRADPRVEALVPDARRRAQSP